MSPSASFSHQARAATLESVRGSFFFHAPNNPLSAEGFDSGPTSNEAVTSPFPGRQTRSHSSHDTWAFSAFRPAGRWSGNVSGTISSVSS